MAKMRSVAVYCGSSDAVLEQFHDSARALGRFLAAEGIELVYGGGRTGLMYSLAKACLEAGGKVYGVTVDFIAAHEGAYTDIQTLVHVETMHARKKQMFDRADAFVVLPGGMGTLDETWEVLTWKQIGLHSKYIFIANIDHYWSQIFSQAIPHMKACGFVGARDEQMYTLVNSIDELYPYLRGIEANTQTCYVNKWG